MKSINPTTKQLIKAYPVFSSSQVEEVINASEASFTTWRLVSYQERSQVLHQVSHILRNKKKIYADLITEEMGKTTKEAIAEIEKSAYTCQYYADHAEEMLKDEFITTEAQKSFITYQPLGSILAIMPWNFPFWQVFRFAAPTLMAGNTALLKHASNVSGCALALEELFQQASDIKNIFCTLLIKGEQVEPVIAHPSIKAVTLTGSTQAGKAVAQVAGKYLKKAVLELGGSDPYIILSDANLEKAVKSCVSSRLINAGQSCIAAKRFIVVEEVYEPFLNYFRSAFSYIKMGDPTDEATDIGPQALHSLRDQLHQQVTDSIAKGAYCILGGYIPNHKGAFYPPTILTNITPGMPAYDDELFGPVASIIQAKDTEDAIRIANDSCFGLGAAVFTENITLGTEIATYRLDAGCIAVNQSVKSDPRLPFGGIKHSGFGRELSYFGVKEFANIKSVVVG